PSSLTVTTAESSRMMGAPAWAARISAGERTKRFSPLSSVERPVPPPMATTRRPRSRTVFSGGGRAAVLVFMGTRPRGRLRGIVHVEVAVGAQFGAGIGIQQLGETRILSQILEVGIVAGL